MKVENPLAFPLGANEYGGHGSSPGMSLADYFAAKAMQAMVSTPTYEGGGWSQVDIARQSYTMANAMLRARTGG